MNGSLTVPVPQIEKHPRVKLRCPLPYLCQPLHLGELQSVLLIAYQ